MATPYMNLNLPVVSDTTGPTWASMLNIALGVVDAHNHADIGVQIPVAGLNINADLSFNGYNIQSPRAVRLEDHGSVPNDPEDISTLASVNDELYYIDGQGNQVQITSGGSLNASSLGAIGGDYGASTALLAFYNINETFVFTKDTNEAAPIDCGPISLRDIAASANSINLKSPVSLASDYDITFPGALPASSRFVQVSSSGQLSFVPTPPVSNSAFVTMNSSGVAASTFAIDGSNNVSGIANLTIGGTINSLTISSGSLTNAVNITMTGDLDVAGDVTISGTGTHSVSSEFANEVIDEYTRSSNTTVGVRGVAISAGSGSYSTTSTSYVDVTNLSVTITTSGRPVVIQLMPSSTSPGYLSTSASSGHVIDMDVQFSRNGTPIKAFSLYFNGGFGAPIVRYAPGGIFAVYPESAGTYTFTVQTRTVANNTAIFQDVALCVYEL